MTIQEEIRSKLEKGLLQGVVHPVNPSSSERAQKARSEHKEIKFCNSKLFTGKQNICPHLSFSQCKEHFCQVMSLLSKNIRLYLKNLAL